MGKEERKQKNRIINKRNRRHKPRYRLNGK